MQKSYDRRKLARPPRDSRQKLSDKLKFLDSKRLFAKLNY